MIFRHSLINDVSTPDEFRDRLRRQAMLLADIHSGALQVDGSCLAACGVDLYDVDADACTTGLGDNDDDDAVGPDGRPRSVWRRLFVSGQRYDGWLLVRSGSRRKYFLGRGNQKSDHMPPLSP